jgi:hypothetical protein
MLDYSYSSWAELIAALREIRAYLRNPDNYLSNWDKPENYSFGKIRAKFEEQAFVSGNGFIVRVVNPAFIG